MWGNMKGVCTRNWDWDDTCEYCKYEIVYHTIYNFSRILFWQKSLIWYWRHPYFFSFSHLDWNILVCWLLVLSDQKSTFGLLYIWSLFHNLRGLKVTSLLLLAEKSCMLSFSANDKCASGRWHWESCHDNHLLTTPRWDLISCFSVDMTIAL